MKKRGIPMDFKEFSKKEKDFLEEHHLEVWKLTAGRFQVRQPGKFDSISKYTYRFTNKENILEIYKDGWNGGDIDDTILFECFKKMGEFLGSNLLIIRKEPLLSNHEVEGFIKEGYLPQSNYKPGDFSFSYSNATLEKFLSRGAHYKFAFVYEYKKGYLQQLKDCKKQLVSFFKKKKKENPTVEIPIFLTYLQSASYYMDGYKGEFSFSIKDGLVIEETTRKMKIDYVNKEQFSNFLEELYQTLQKERRLKNLYENPSQHFNKMIGELNINVQSERLFSSLSKYINPKELEEKCASDETYAFTKNDVMDAFSLFQIFDVFVVYSTKYNKSFDFKVFTNKEDALNCLENEELKFMKKKIDVFRNALNM